MLDALGGPDALDAQVLPAALPLLPLQGVLVLQCRRQLLPGSTRLVIHSDQSIAAR